MTDLEIMEAATRIYNIFIYEMRDADQTPKTIYKEIKKDPAKTINFLLDHIENN